MTLHKFSIAIASSIMVLTLSACSTVKEHSNILETSKIMKESKGQIALVINKDLSIDILGVRAGKLIERFDPCDEKVDSDCRSGRYSEQQELSLQKTDKSTPFEKYTANLTVVIKAGSCCVTVSRGSSTTEYCSPKYPVAFINAQTGAICE